MADETLDQKIMSGWESAGLDASADTEDAPTVESDGEEPVESDTPDAEEVQVDDPDAAPDPAEEVVDPEATETEGETETPAEETPAKTAEQVQKDADDDLAEALGLGKPPADPKKRAAWWKSRLPYSQVHKEVVAREKRLREAHEGVVKTHTTKISEYDTRFADVQKVENLIKDEPEHYVKTLATLFPDTYGKMFAPLLGDGTTPVDKATLPTEVDPGPKPEADLDLGDGRKTYSIEGYDKLMEWQRLTTEQNMLKRFKPHMDFMDSQRKAAEKAQKDQQSAETIKRGREATDKAVAEVRTWDLGEQNLKEIVDEAAKLGPDVDVATALNIAYRKVVIPKMKQSLTADRDKVRAEVLAELKKKSAKQTAAGLQTQTRTVVPKTPATGDLDERLKAKWKREGLI